MLFTIVQLKRLKMKDVNNLRALKILLQMENRNLNFSKTSLLLRRLTASKQMPSWRMPKIHFVTSTRNPRRCRRSCVIRSHKPSVTQLRVALALATRLNRR